MNLNQLVKQYPFVDNILGHGSPKTKNPEFKAKHQELSKIVFELLKGKSIKKYDLTKEYIDIIGECGKCFIEWMNRTWHEYYKPTCEVLNVLNIPIPDVEHKDL